MLFTAIFWGLIIALLTGHYSYELNNVIVVPTASPFSSPTTRPWLS